MEDQEIIRLYWERDEINAILGTIVCHPHREKHDADAGEDHPHTEGHHSSEKHH